MQLSIFCLKSIFLLPLLLDALQKLLSSVLKSSQLIIYIKELLINLKCFPSWFMKWGFRYLTAPTLETMFWIFPVWRKFVQRVELQAVLPMLWMK